MKAFMILGVIVILFLGFPFTAPFFIIAGLYEMFKNKRRKQDDISYYGYREERKRPDGGFRFSWYRFGHRQCHHLATSQSGEHCPVR